ncbi:MAG TPA: 6-phosphogluconolactonase [Ktedonobacteraceae bacterium]|nr:6-phosphogluconolactonase [Ktedonobacteraceae bacterium]
MQIAIYPDIDKISSEAAAYAVRVAREAVAERGSFSFALSGGTTPGKLYSLLASEPYRGQIDWSAVHLFWSDERCVAPDDPQSNYSLAQQTLLSKLNLRPEQIHRMPADRPDREQAATDYAAEIRSVLNRGDVPVFDLLQLGMGPEAHTASLFPHQPSLRERKRLVMPVSVPKPPPDRLTFTPPLLLAARHILFLATGSDKAEALHEVIDGAYQPEEYPAQFIAREARGEVVWMVDSAIAQRLSQIH